MDTEFHGRGISFPVLPGFAQSAGVRKVEESILIILGTQYGERVMRPRFGCNLKSLAFAPNNGSTANLARYYVEAGLTQWEPRIELIDVSVQQGAVRQGDVQQGRPAIENDPLGAVLLIDITYRLRATQDVHNLTYPFFLERP